MTTDIGIEVLPGQQAPRRDWLLPTGGSYYGHALGGVLDASLFAADRYPNGFVPSGTVLARHTNGRLAPYAAGGANGTGTAVGFLFDAVTIKSATARPGVAYVVGFAVVRAGRLPWQTGAGSLDSAARTALNLFYYES